MQNAVSILEKYKKLVWPEIEKYLVNPQFPKAFNIPSAYEAETKLQWQIFSEYPKRQGKYLRPTLLMLTAQSMGAQVKYIIDTAAAMQISEDWILIHDDVEDDSLDRRGKPTLHKMYSRSLATNAGDMLHAIQYRILTENIKKIGAIKTYKINEEFFRFSSRTVLGQGVEINRFEGEVKIYTDADWEFIADSKSSYYTIAGPMRLGAILADATNIQLESIARFGVYLGRCFQLVDDVLDVISDFQGQKKQIGNDIYEGKRTIILGHLLRSVNSKDSVKLHHILEKPRDQKSDSEVKWVTQKMHDYKSIEYATKLATKYRDQAYKIFENDLKFLKKEPYRSELETLIHFVLERKH